MINYIDLYRKESIWIECVLLLPLLLWTAGSQEVDVNDPEFPWKKIGVSPKKVLTILLTHNDSDSFKFNVYQDIANIGEKSIKNRFYYCPLSFMDYSTENKPTITSGAQNVRSVHFSITILMNNKLRDFVRKMLSNELRQEIASNQIFLFPFKRVILRNSNKPTEGFDVAEQNYWVPYSNEKFLSFSIRCASNEICLNIKTSLSSDPKFVAKLKLTYDLGDTFTSVKQVPVYAKNVCERPIFANLLKENKISSEVQGTEYEIDQLVSELIFSLSKENFNFETETVNYQSYSEVKSFLEQRGFFSKRTEYSLSNADLYKKAWNSFEWNKNNEIGFSNVNDAFEFVNNLNKNLEYPYNKYLTDFFSTSLTFDKPRKESINPNFPINMSIPRTVNKPPNLSLIQAIEKARIVVAWDGTKFMPKTLIVRKIFLSKCRSMSALPHTEKDLRYSKAFFTMPISHQPLDNGKGWTANYFSKIR